MCFRRSQPSCWYRYFGGHWFWVHSFILRYSMQFTTVKIIRFALIRIMPWLVRIHSSIWNWKWQSKNIWCNECGTFNVHYSLLYLVSATIVVCYGIAVICYQFAKKSAKNRYTPEAADILDTPEIDDPYIETNDNENNLVAYVWISFFPWDNDW